MINPEQLIPIPVPDFIELSSIYIMDVIKTTEMFSDEIVTAQDADKVRMMIEGMITVRDRMMDVKAKLPCTPESSALHEYYREKVQDSEDILARLRIKLDTWESNQIQTVGTYKNGI